MIDSGKIKELSKQAEGLSVLYVEDDVHLQRNTLKLLSRFFEKIDTASNGKEGIEKYSNGAYDIVITDIRMPVMNGIEMAAQIREINPAQPIIVTSAHDESQFLIELINLNVSSFVLKPIDASKIIDVLRDIVDKIWVNRYEHDYKRLLEEAVKDKTRELSDVIDVATSLGNELMQRLVAASEQKDTDTGSHIVRIGLYAEHLAREMGMTEDFISSIAFGAQLHDIGKIGIKDSILLKSGPLTAEEFDTMKSHTEIGAKILSGSKYARIQMAEAIARCHHEKWDGTGYPRGLTGTDIPLEARIVIICDQYDALAMKRPYKQALEHKEVVRIITEGDGRTMPQHFDPEVLNIFAKVSDNFMQIYGKNNTAGL
ncbi:HD domain-containing phosphohydrolase [Candidatus Magnetomonas plexicatena]|uniref:HD domain-containing phosphohydrolase n=1 Tax=Candidatus Magnetomonas plexicatena TaxID=2552947 RepID=UPI0011031355|nr:response regulator [Nitrospirales bacterium LBB_01]